jgi:hypothetical protein
VNIMIDMDGVICSEEKTFERALARPLDGAREALAALRAAGHQVVIYTARSWSELAMTKDWLARHDIAYDGLHMGKPVADRIVDDRAIPFSGWPASLEALSRAGRPDVDEEYLRILRLATVDFLRRIAADSALRGTVLEVGPMTRTGLNSPVYERFPGAFFDTRAAIAARGLRYVSLDLDPDARPDFCCDLLEADRHVPAASLGAVIMMSCLEHIPAVFKVPALLDRLLEPGGMAYLLTPWNLRFHGPRPDCWRISDDGYRALFGELFEIVELEPIACPGRSLSPVGMRCVLRKPATRSAPPR